MEEHRRVGLRLELLQHGVRERRVDRHVALLPGVREAGVESRLVRQVPEVVLDEPERRVGDDVVVPVVGVLVVRDEPQPVRRPVARRLLDRALGGDRAILRRDRARDPRHVVVRDQPAQRGHEPAAAAPRDTAAGVVAA